MIRNDLGLYATVISSKRPGNVAKMEALVGPCTWYVGTGEKQSYLDAGASAVVEAGKLVASRNAALRDGWALNLPVLELSDDLTTLEEVINVGGPIDSDGNPVKLSKDAYLKLVPISFPEVIKRLHGDLEKTGAYLAGLAPVCNLFYINKMFPLTSASFIIGDFILVKPCDLYFDENLSLKEDYEFGLQHMNRYGVVARDNFIFAKFAHYSNAGGAVAYRNDEREAHACEYIMTKWANSVYGPYMKPNPRRKNELMFRVPKKMDKYIMKLRSQEVLNVDSSMIGDPGE